MDVARVLAVEGRASQGLVSASQLRRAGVSRSHLSRAVACGAVVRVCARVYALTTLPSLPRFVVTDGGVSAAYVAQARAVLISLGASATAYGRTAAALYGWGLLVEPGRTVEIAVPHGRSRVTLRHVRTVQRRSADRVRRVVLADTAALWITTPIQTVLDCALELPLLQAVVVCDSALRAGDVTVEQLQRAVRCLPGIKDSARARRVVQLCDPDCGSVLESVLRVSMVQADIAGFATQRIVRDQPGRYLRVDFCFEACGLVVEVDGVRWHQDPARDQARDNALARLGWRVLRFTWAEVVHDTERVLEDIRDAVGCATPSFHLGNDSHDEAA